MKTASGLILLSTLYQLAVAIALIVWMDGWMDGFAQEVAQKVVDFFRFLVANGFGRIIVCIVISF